jgi:hypothetical protein
MSDLDSRLRSHLRRRARDVDPIDRLDDVRAGRRTALDAPRAPGRPWVRAAAAAVAAVAAGAGAFALVTRADHTRLAFDGEAVDAGPTTNDHWHEAYGFWLCGTWVTLQGTLEDDGRLEVYNQTGVHSHDDGVIHIHPFTSRSTGANADLQVFLDGYGVVLTDESLGLPAGDGGGQFDESSGRCGADAAELSVVVWPDADDPGVSRTYTGDFGSIPLEDGAAVTIAFAPAGAIVPMPPSAANLAELSGVDNGAPLG